MRRQLADFWARVYELSVILSLRPQQVLDDLDFQDIDGLTTAFLSVNGRGGQRAVKLDALDKALIAEAKQAASPPSS